MGREKIWEVPRESNLVEAAKVILIGFLGIKNPAVLHVLQRWTYGIRKFGFFAGVCVITGHCVMHVPFIMALTDHLVPPLAKFLIQEVGIFASLSFPFTSRSLLSMSGSESIWEVLGLLPGVFFVGGVAFVGVPSLESEELELLSASDFSLTAGFISFLIRVFVLAISI